MAAFPARATGVPSDHLLLSAAVSAYLGRYRGQTRLHTESDLWIFLRWCADLDLHPLTRHLSSRCLARAAGVGGRVVPAQHPQCPQGVPPARRAVGFLEPEVDRAGVVVLEQPTPVGSAFCADAFDCFGQPRIRSAPTPGEVLRGLEQVVVPAWGVGE